MFIQLTIAKKLQMIESSSLFQRNLHIFAVILVYELLKYYLFYIAKITLQYDKNFPCVAEFYGERTDIRGKFRKNRNIDLENSSLLQCKAKTLYYNCLEGFSLEIIFSTVTVELNFSAI